MKYLFITIVLFLFASITRAQKINPYLLNDHQIDSLNAVQARATNDTLKMETDAIFSMYYSENNKDSYLLSRFVLMYQGSISTDNRILSVTIKI